MPRPTADQVHADQMLTNLAIGMFQDNADFIWHQAFPIIPVQKKSDNYYVFDNEYFMRDDLQERPPATESAGTEMTLSDDTYNAKVFAVHYDLSDQVDANADFDMESRIVRLLVSQVHQHMERRVASAFLAASIWDTDLTGVASGPTANQFVQWNAAASDPVRDIMLQSNLMKAATNKRPNTLIIGPDVFAELSVNAGLLERFTGSGTTMLSLEQIARAIGVERVLVADAVKATNAAGQAKTTAFILGKVALLAYTERGGPSMEAASAGYVFNWTGLDQSALSATGPQIYQFYIPEKRTWRFEAQIAYDLKVTATTLGKFFASAVA